MEDYLNYMNSVSESESVLNQVNAIKESVVNQADIKEEEKDQLKEQITGIPSELLISSAGAYLGKKAISYVASKIGVSEDTVGKFVSGDIEGGLKQGLGEVGKNNMPSYGQEAEQELPEPEMAPEQAGDIEMQDLTPPSQDEALNMLAGEERPTMTNEDLPEGAGAIEDVETPITDIGEDITSGLTDIGETVSSTVGDVITSGLDTVGSVITSGLDTVGSVVGDVASSVAETAGAEAVGAGLDATGVLAPLGALVGLIGGFVGLFEGMHHDAPKIVQAYEPMLNPSSQIL
jgi:hypothetical protein